MSLLDDVKSAPVQTKEAIGDTEKLEVAVAWMKGDVRGIQVSRVLGISNPGKVWFHMFRIVRDGIRSGKLAVSINKGDA